MMKLTVTHEHDTTKIVSEKDNARNVIKNNYKVVKVQNMLLLTRT